MATSGAEARLPVLHCDQAESVLAAIEENWKAHHGRRPGFVLGLYPALAQILNEEGVIIDTLDGLSVLEHCRRRSLPIVSLLYELETRVRAAGYRGDRLSLADFYAKTSLVYAFYDPSRFSTFEALKQKVNARLTSERAPPERPQA